MLNTTTYQHKTFLQASLS